MICHMLSCEVRICGHQCIHMMSLGYLMCHVMSCDLYDVILCHVISFYAVFVLYIKSINVISLRFGCHNYACHVTDIACHVTDIARFNM